MAVKKSTTEKEKPAKKTAKKPASSKAMKATGKKKPKEEKNTKVVSKGTKTKVEAKKDVISEAKAKEKAVSNISRSDAEKYYYAVGRSKSSVAQVRIFEDEKASDADLLVNGKKLKEYFPTVSLQNNLLFPFKSTSVQGKFRMTALVRGGGTTGQAEAIRLGIARALVKYNEAFKKPLKDLGLMTRDSREVERKKAGLKKARRAPQWAKR